MKTILTAFFIGALIILYGGCSNEMKQFDDMGASDLEPDEQYLSTEQPIEQSYDEEENPSFPKVDKVYDFSELSEDTFPRGVSTVNQLKNKYGDEKKATVFFRDIYNTASVVVDFDDTSIVFGYDDPARYSFSDEFLDKDGYFDLSENEKNFELEISSVTTSAQNAELPGNLQIGQSTKEQVLSFYTENTAYKWQNYDEEGNFDTDMVMYFYGFPNEKGINSEVGNSGNMEYLFDEDGVLSEVTVCWFPTAEKKEGKVNL